MILTHPVYSTAEKTITSTICMLEFPGATIYYDTRAAQKTNAPDKPTISSQGDDYV